MQSTEPWGEQDGDSVEGGWDAVDVETGRRMRHRVVLAGSLLADFRFVAFGLDEEDFGKRADEILSTVTVTPPE